MKVKLQRFKCWLDQGQSPDKPVCLQHQTDASKLDRAVASTLLQLPINTNTTLT